MIHCSYVRGLIHLFIPGRSKVFGIKNEGAVQKFRERVSGRPLLNKSLVIRGDFPVIFKIELHTGDIRGSFPFMHSETFHFCMVLNQ